MKAEKAAARTEALARRAAVPECTRHAAADRLAETLVACGGRLLAGYLAMRDEADPAPALAGHEGGLCLPVILGKGRALGFRSWHPGAALVSGPFGTREPAEGALVLPQVLVVPLLAFDARGFRLGYGGGFYDRTLAELRAAGPVLAIGFAFSAQEMADLPREDTDQPLDAVVTEAGMRYFG